MTELNMQAFVREMNTMMDMHGLDSTLQEIMNMGNSDTEFDMTSRRR